MKREISKLTALTLLSGSMLTEAYAADSFSDAIKNATTYGQFRLAYIGVTPDVAGANSTSATAFGGRFKFETEQWNRLRFAIAPYFSQKLTALSGHKGKGKLNGDFFDANGESYAYLGEAYVNYAFNKGTVRLGRQLLDTPFINGDDIRLFPNTFSAGWLNMGLGDSITLDAGVVSEWAGFDSGGSQDKFKTAENDGVSALGLHYRDSDTMSAQGWYYNFSQSYTLLYLDTYFKKGAFSLAAQYGSYQETNSSNVDGSVVGVRASYAMGPLTLGAAMNKGSNDAGKSASLGLGGGNFYTSMDEMTIGGLTDASARVVSADYAVSEKLNIGVALGHFEDEARASTNTDETDLVLSYIMSDQLDVAFVHTRVVNKAAANDAASNFSRSFARLNYNF